MPLLTYAPPVPWYLEVAKTASYTVLATDQGTLFTNAGAGGAVTFTLPTLQAGLMYWFQAQAAQNLLVSGSANIMAIGNAAATTVQYSTVNQIIGGLFSLTANAAGTLWYLQTLALNSITVS